MKRSVLINLICSMLVTVILIISVLLVLIFTGKLDIEKQKLVISSASHAVVYDGKTLTDGRWSLIEGELKENHKLSVSVTGSQTSVGMSENYVNATIHDQTGKDVTKEYSVEYRPGALQVKARELTLLAESAMKLYDGTPLVCNAYLIQSSVALLPTDELHVTVEGSLTEVGEAVNQITAATVTDAHGQDVTRNYSIHSKSGKLIIYDEKALVLQSGDATKVYDGSALTCTEWTTINGQLKPGHQIVPFNFASLTTCGNIPNSFDVRVVDESGNDVSHMYEIFTDYGTLSVTQANLSIVGNNVVGAYGTSGFSCNSEEAYEVIGLPEGYTIRPLPGGVSGEVPAFSGSEDAKNSVPNVIDPTKFEVLNKEGQPVTENFQINATNGSLSVLPPSGEMTYFYIKPLSNDMKTIYLKERSYGAYDPKTNSWQSAPDYTFDSTDIASSYYLINSAFHAVNLTDDEHTARVEIDPVGGIFALPYYTTSQQHLQKSDHTIVGDATKGSYTVNYFSSNPSKKGQISVEGRISALESNYYESFVKAHYLYVDGETEAFLLQYAAEHHLDAESETIVSDVAALLRNYWRSGLTYNMEYDRSKVDRAGNPTIAFLNAEKEGVCRHYAQAATLLYRTLGIPARYTVGFVCDNLDELDEDGRVAVTDEKAHAWVEVYLEGTGWVYVEVTGGSNKALDLTVKPDDKIEKFKPDMSLRATTATITELSGTWEELLLNGYNYDIEFAGEATEIGMATSRVASFKIFDSSGASIYEYANGNVLRGSNLFNVKYDTGTLRYYRNEILWSTASFEKTYGDEWSSNLEKWGVGYTYTIDGVTLNAADDYAAVEDWTEGHQIRVIFTGKETLGKKAENQANTLTIRIVDADGIDVTHEYYCKPSPDQEVGALKITPRKITVAAGSMTVSFDSISQMSYDEAIAGTYVSSGSLVYGDEIVLEGLEIKRVEIDRPGNYKTSIVEGTLKIKDTEGKDVTGYYSIDYQDGDLKVR